MTKVVSASPGCCQNPVTQSSSLCMFGSQPTESSLLLARVYISRSLQLGVHQVWMNCSSAYRKHKCLVLSLPIFFLWSWYKTSKTGKSVHCKQPLTIPPPLFVFFLQIKGRTAPLLSELCKFVVLLSFINLAMYLHNLPF